MAYRDELTAALGRCAALEAELEELRAAVRSESSSKTRAIELRRERDFLRRELAATRGRLDDVEWKLKKAAEQCPSCGERRVRRGRNGRADVLEPFEIDDDFWKSLPLPEELARPEEFVNAAVRALARVDLDWLSRHADPQLTARVPKLAPMFAGGCAVVSGRRDTISHLDDWEFEVDTRYAGRWQILFNRDARSAPEYRLYFVRKIA